MIDFFSGPRAYIAGETYVDIDGNGRYEEGVDTPLDTATLGSRTTKRYRLLSGCKESSYFIFCIL